MAIRIRGRSALKEGQVKFEARGGRTGEGGQGLENREN